MMSFTPLILAGGWGTRLKPVIPNLPKVLSPVNNRPFLSYIFDQLINLGIGEVVVCIGYLGEMIIDAFGYKYRKLSIQYSHEPVSLGTGGAINYALKFVYSESVLIMNGDSYCDVDLKSYIDWFFKNKYYASIVLTKVTDASRYGRVKINKEGCIINFDEKSGCVQSGWINGGIYILNKLLLKNIPAYKKTSLEYDFFPKLLKEKKLYGFCSHGKFIDIGTPESYHLAEELFRNNKTL